MKYSKWLALLVTSLGSLFSTINASSINIANPILAAEFSITMEQVQWVVTIYLIFTSSLMLLMGRIGDRVGSHKVYILGTIVFTTGSLACGFSGSFVVLLLCRAVQALGASMTVATALGLVTSIFPPEQRGMALGINAITVALGNFLGPSLGGLVLAVSNWHMIFFVTVPVSALACMIAIVVLRSPVPPLRNAPPLDKLGTALLFAIITSIILALSGGFAGSQWFLLVFVVIFIVFLRVERKQKEPLLDLRLLRKSRFALGNLIALLSYTGNTMVLFQLPFFLEELWQMSVGEAGLLLTITSVCMAIAAPLGGIISDRVGAMRVMPPAILVLIAAFTLALFIPAEPSYPLLIIYLALVGLGTGCLNTPNNSEMMTAVGREFSGYASGFIGTNRNLAFCLGTGASAGIFGFIHSLTVRIAPADGAYLLAFRSIFGICLLLMIISLILCMILLRNERTSR